MSLDTLEFSMDGDVAVITLNRPEAGNSLNLAMARELLAVGLKCECDPAVRAVVLTGGGKMFCFGGDLNAMAENENVQGFLNELTTNLHAAVSCFNRMDSPVIAAVNGTAAGAGVGLMAMADLAIAADDARFNLAYTGVALTPDGSTTYFLPRMIGRRRAAELMLTNRTLSAGEALDWGLVNQVVPAGALIEEAMSLANRLAKGPKGAYGATKRLLESSTAQTLETQMALEGRTIAAQSATPEGREGVSAFLAKRKPEFV